jgi:hypothetical protein
MVIFMPYYRQHGQLLHSHPRSRPSSSNGQNNTTTNPTYHMSTCRFASNILCRFIFSFFLFAIAFVLFQLSINNMSNKKEGSNVIAAILLTVAIVSFLRTCQTLRRYLTILQTRGRLVQVKKPAIMLLVIYLIKIIFYFRDYVNDNKLMI